VPLWVVENRPFPVLWPLAYTTACTAVQAVLQMTLYQQLAALKLASLPLLQD